MSNDKNAAVNYGGADEVGKAAPVNYSGEDLVGEPIPDPEPGTVQVDEGDGGDEVVEVVEVVEDDGDA
jgi:hypothetical protein